MKRTTRLLSRLATLALLALIGLWGCDPDLSRSNPYDENAPATEQAPATVRGAVLLEQQPEGQQDAVSVTLEGPGQTLTTTTGADGSFAFESSVIPGNWLLRFNLANYQEYSYGPFDATVAGSIDIPTVNLLLRRASLSGSVKLEGVDEQGEALEDFSGVQVMVRQASPTVSTKQTKLRDDEPASRSYSTVTDSEGSFFLDEVPFGDYDLVAGKNGFSSAAQDVSVGENQVLISGIVLVSSLGALSLNDGAGVTNQPTLTALLKSSGPMKTWWLSEDPAFEDETTITGDIAQGLEADFVETPFTLRDGDGTRVVYGKYETLAGLPSELSSAVILLDTTPPQNTSVLIANGAAYFTDPVVNLSLSANDRHSGVTGMRVCLDGTFDDEPVVDYALSQTVTLPVPAQADGESVTVSVRYLDGAGNESDVTSDDILFDNTPPSFAASAMTINDGDAATAQSLVTLDFQVTGADYLKVSNDSGLGGASWEPFRSSMSGWRLADGDVEGTKTVYAQFKDEAGNETTIVQATIALQTKGSIGGTLAVVPADTPTPYANVTFALDGQTLSDVTVNETDGSFTLNGIRHGIYSSLTISKADFLPVQIAAVMVEPMATTNVGDVRLTSRYGSIAGALSVVPGDTPTPFADVTFSLDGQPLGSGLGEITLDEESGSFTLNRIPTGTYGLLRVRKAGFADATAMGLAVSAEMPTQTGELSLVSLVGSLHGTLAIVADDTTNAYQGLTWLLDGQALGDGLGAISLNEADGSFSIAELPTGTYGKLEVRKSGFTGAQSGIVRVKADEAADLGTLTLTGQTGSITGTLAFVPASTPNALDGLTFLLDGQAVGSGLGEITLDEATSTFAIRGIPNGIYSSLVVRKADFTDATSRTLNVQAGTPVDLGALTLSSLYGSISGQVSLEGASLVTDVTLYLANQAVPDASIQENGAFTLPRVLVGTYASLTARKSGYAAARTEMLVIASGEDLNVGVLSLSLSRGSLEGTVTLVGRSDHSGVILTLLGTSHSMVTDAGGYFFKDNIVASNYDLMIQKDGFQQKIVPITILPDETTTVETQQLSPQSGDFRIAGGAAFTNQTTVDLELDYDNAAALRVSEDDGFFLNPDVTEPPFLTLTDLVDAGLLTIEPNGTMHYAYTFEEDDLSGTIQDGFKTIYVQFQDTDSLSSPAYSASITLDRVAPSLAEIEINGGAAYTNSATGLVTLTLSAYDENDVDFVYLSKNGTTFTSSAYVPSKSYILAQPDTDGEKTVWAYFVDPAGNQSERVSDSILLDTEPPQFVAFAIDASVEVAGVKYTTTASVNLTMEVSGATQMMLANSGAFTGAVWEPYASSRSWALPNLEREHTVYARFQDEAGNMIGSEGTIHDAITLDLTPPPTPQFTPTGTGVVGYYTNSQNIQLQFTNAPTGVKAQVATDLVFTEAAFNLPVGGMVDFQLPDRDGNHVVYARYIDIAGNAGTPAQVSLTLDRSAPYGERISVSGGSVQNTLSVTLELSAVGASEVLVIAGSTCSGSSWAPYVTQMAVTATGSDGLKTFSAKFRDAAHNESNCISTTFRVDRQAPTLSVQINEGAAYANTRGVTLTVTASDGASGTVSAMRLTNESSFGSESWEPYLPSKSWTLSSGSDTKTVRVQVKDEAGNVRESTDQITLDLSSPTGVSLAIQDTNGYVQSPTVTVTITASDNLTDANQLVYLLSNSPSFSNAVTANYQNGGVTRAWTLSAGDGEKNVYLRIVDLAGNITEAGDSTVLDSSGPNGSSVSILEGSYVSSPDVTLIAISPGADEMQITGDVMDTSSTFEWTSFATSTSLTLDESACDEGYCEILVSFRDAAGYGDGPVSLYVMLDETAPSGSVIINEGDSHTDTRSVMLSLNVTDNRTGVSAMRLTNNASFTTEEWEPFVTEKSWTLQSDNGTRAVLVQVKDAAGNVRTLTDDIILDTQAPTGLSISINSGAAYATSRSVSIELDAADNLSAEANLVVLLSNESSFMQAATQALVQGGITVPWTLSEGDGTKNVYLRVMDEAGNLSSATDAIVLDSQLPQATLTVMGNDPTNATSATLVFTASSDVSLMRIQNTASINCATGSYEPYSSQKAGWLLGTTSGLKTVSGCFKDTAGNTVSASDSVTLDVDLPTGTLSVNEGDTMTEERLVSLTLANVSDPTSSVTQMRVTNAPSFGSEEWEPFTTTRSWMLGTTNGPQTVRVQIRDAAGNATELTDEIVFDNQPPSGLVIRINNEAARTNSQTVSVFVNGTDNVTDPDEMTFQLSNTSSFNNATSYAFTPGGRTITGWALTTGDGEKTVMVRFTDAVGNHSDAAATIFLDTTAPEAVVEILGNDPTNSPSVTVNLPVFDTKFIKLAVAETIDCTSGVTTPFPVSGRVEDVVLGSTGGSKTVSVCFKDEAGNISSASDTVTLDIDQPDGTLSIDDGDATTASRAVTLTFTVSDATTSVSDIRISNEMGFTGIDWEPLTTPRNWQLKSENGEQTVRAEIRDAAGNTRVISDTIILDNQPPHNLNIVVSSGVVVEGTRYVASRSIVASVSAEDAISPLSGLSFYVANEPSFSSSTTPLADLSNFAWTLSEGDGEKNVYLKVTDESGNSSTIMTTLFLDTEAPSAALTILGPNPTNQNEATLEFNVDADVTQMKLQNTTSIDCSSGVTTPLPPSRSVDHWSLGSTSGTITVSACFADRAGNTTSASSTVVLDLDRPTGSLVIEGSDPTKTPSVTLTITASNDVDSMAVVNGDTLNCATAPYEPFSSNRSWMLPSPTGSKVVTLCLRDEAGNTNSGTIQDSVYLDLTPPNVNVTIGDGSGTVTSNLVTLHFDPTTPADTNDVWKYSLQNLASFSCSNITDWSSYPNYPTNGLVANYDLGTRSGVQETVHVTACFADRAGNTQSQTRSVFVDRRPPTGTVSLGSQYYRDDNGDGTVEGTATITASEDVSKMAVIVTTSYGTIPSCASVAWEDFATTKTVTLIKNDTLETGINNYVWVCLKDEAGNVTNFISGDPYIRTYCNVDTNAPSGIATITPGTPTNSPYVTVGFSSVSADVTSVALSNDPQTCSEANYINYTSPMGWQLPAEDGSHTVHVCFKDRAGNTGSDESNAIVLDLTPPPAPTPLTPQDNGYATTRRPTLTWTPVTAASTYTVYWEYASDSGSAGPQAGTSYTLTLAQQLPDGAFVSWYVKAQDAVGNMSELSPVHHFTVDITAPTYTNIQINSGDDYTRLTSVYVKMTSVSGADSMMIACDGILDTEQWIPFNPAHNCTLSDGDGTKTVRARFKDLAGNVAPSTYLEDTILLDQTPPAPPVISTEPTVVSTSQVQFIVGDTCSDTGGSGCKSGEPSIEFKGGTVFSNWSKMTSYDFTSPGNGWNITLRANVSNKLSARYYDNAGNVSTEEFVIIRHDNTRPERPTNLELTASDRTLKLTWTPSTSSDVAGYKVYYGFDTSPYSLSDFDGNFAHQGQSPITIGNVNTYTLTGLTNDMPVAVTVMAYDKTEVPGPNESTNSSALTQVGTPMEVPLTMEGYGLNGEVDDMIVYKGWVYTVSKTQGVQIFRTRDIIAANGGTITPVGSLNSVEVQRSRLEHYGNYLYLYDDGWSATTPPTHYGVAVVNVGNPTAPTLVRETMQCTGSFPYNQCFVVYGLKMGLHAYNTTTTTRNGLYVVAAVRPYGLLGYSGLFLIRIPVTNLEEILITNMDGAGNDSVQLSDPSTSDASKLYRMDIDSRFAYLSTEHTVGDTQRFFRVQINDPTVAMSVITEATQPVPSRDLVSSYPYSFVAAQYGMYILDQYGNRDYTFQVDTSRVAAIQVSPGLAFIGYSEGDKAIRAISLDTHGLSSGSLNEVGSYRWSSSHTLRGKDMTAMKLEGNYLYASFNEGATSGLAAFKISQPSRFDWKHQISSDTGDDFRGFAVNKDIIYTVSYTDTVSAYRVWNPEAPSRLWAKTENVGGYQVVVRPFGASYLFIGTRSTSGTYGTQTLFNAHPSSSYAEKTYSIYGSSRAVNDVDIHGNAVIVAQAGTSTCVRSYALGNIMTLPNGTSYGSFECAGLSINGQYIFAGRKAAVNSNVYTYRLLATNPLTPISSSSSVTESSMSEYVALTGNADHVLGWLAATTSTHYMLRNGYTNTSITTWIDHRSSNAGRPDLEYYGTTQFNSTGTIWDLSVPASPTAFSEMPGTIHEIHILGAFYFLRNSSISGYMMEP